MLRDLGLFLTLLVPLFFVTWRRILAPDDRRPLTRLRRAAMVLAGIALGLSLVDLGALAHLSLRQAVSVRTSSLAMTAFAVYLALHRTTPERHRRPLVLAAFAFALVAGREFVFVWDRMNTVLNFYLEACSSGLASPAPCSASSSARREGLAPRVRATWRGRWGGDTRWPHSHRFPARWAPDAPPPRGPALTLDGTAYL